jgi:transcriptional regulator with XRE-family HTH domain
LRQWRERRRLSQLELSSQAEISTRHLSFVETGRAKPTSAMILRISEHLDVPLRERNALLLAGGYAPVYAEHEFAGPQLDLVRGALGKVLSGHLPYPAVVINRWWELLDANPAIALFTEDVAPELLEPPVNVLRLSLHPAGMAPRIGNLGQWRAHLLDRLTRQTEATGDEMLLQLLTELRGYPAAAASAPVGPADVVVPLKYNYHGHQLSLFSITAVVGTPLDITVSELAIESFYPADSATTDFLQQR